MKKTGQSPCQPNQSQVASICECSRGLIRVIRPGSVSEVAICHEIFPGTMGTSIGPEYTSLRRIPDSHVFSDGPLVEVS